MLRSMLTTTDNPHDPFTNYDEWYSFDQNAGYHTPGYLARIVVLSEELSDADQVIAIEDGIDEIIMEDELGIYKKVQKEFPDP